MDKFSGFTAGLVHMQRNMQKHPELHPGPAAGVGAAWHSTVHIQMLVHVPVVVLHTLHLTSVAKGHASALFHHGLAHIGEMGSDTAAAGPFSEGWLENIATAADTKFRSVTATGITGVLHACDRTRPHDEMMVDEGLGSTACSNHGRCIENAGTT
jgi:hypothetical protein